MQDTPSSPMQANKSILFIAIMSTKVEYDDALSTIDPLSTIGPCPNIYNLLKVDGIIKANLAMIPPTQSTILGFTLQTQTMLRPSKF